MSNRKMNVTKKELKAMTPLEMAALLTADELKENIIKFMDDYDVPECFLDTLLEALEPLITEKEYTEFCDGL